MTSRQLHFKLVLLAAALLTAAACTHSRPGKKTASQARPAKPDFPVDSTFVTPADERRGFRLPDASGVLLNAASRLAYARGFREDRRLFLDGDAFFNLREDTTPTRLRTGMLLLEARKARFRVYAHGESAGESVEVLSGHLTAAKAYPSDYPDTERLGAGDMVMINRDIDLMEKETFDTAALHTWLSGSLVFRESAFADVIRRLEDWYDIDISVSGDPVTDTLSASFQDASLATVLDTLAARTNMTYRISAQGVVIRR